MKRKSLAYLFFLAGLALISYGFSNQPPSGLTGAPDEDLCTNCHITNSINDGIGSLQLTSNGGQLYQSNLIYQMDLTMTRLGSEVFGFSLCVLDSSLADGGDLLITDSVATQYENFGRAYISHKNALSQENRGSNSVTRSFEWTAPDTATGPVTFYFVSHMVDPTAQTIDGYIYNDSLTIYPIGTPGFENSIDEKRENLVSIYPNPAMSNSYVYIDGFLFDSYHVYDWNGKLVKSELSHNKNEISTWGMKTGFYYLLLGKNSESNLLKLVVF